MSTKESTVSHWDAYWRKGNLQYVNKIVEELEKTGPLAGKTILEIGAGSGATSIKLAQMGSRLICLDYSRNAINVIRNNSLDAQTDVACVLADANALPFKENAIDICFHQGFLEHFRDCSTLLSEQHRVLKTGGVLLADVPQRYSLYALKKRLLIALGKWFAGWETDFSMGGLRRLIRGFGFTYGWGYGRFHIRNIDRIQKKFLGRTILPVGLEKRYYKIVTMLENTFWGTHTAFSIGIVARKEKQPIKPCISSTPLRRQG
jgi:ubiquinone/menaquinone biosynthesis C-methylase UbiE